MSVNLSSTFLDAVGQAYPDIDRGAAASVRVLMLTGYGLNCEAETEAAFACFGARVDAVHVSDFLASGGEALRRYAIIAFIGGFAFGDHVDSGRVLANRLRFAAGREFDAYAADGGLAIGMCNGMQIMAKLGLLPGARSIPGASRDPVDLAALPAAAVQPMSVVANRRRGYRNAWVKLAVDGEGPCVFTKGLTELECPSRHGEGRIVFASPDVHDRLAAASAFPVRYLGPDGQVTETWPHNPNGSSEGIAGVCDPSGRIFGLMPHPEAAIYPESHPRWRVKQDRGQLAGVGEGLALFANGIRAALAR